ncbi:hypothetical protein N752_25460 [Desulforamulus aquiferis]|nr:amidohydrolase family protein [Desulforamulus aquiferis]RYD02303.1 hypothetical protein N752_25460 [Desulforamulus aquiferis]
MMDWGPEVPGTLLEGPRHPCRKVSGCWKNGMGKGGAAKLCFNPRFAVSCTEELLIKVGELAKQYDVLIHTHASENRDEIALVQRERNMRNVAYFEHLGLAGKNLVLAHCIWLDEQELEILQRYEVKVAHCPSCNLKLGSGIAPIPEMLKRGIKVSIGADGAPCNNNLDIFTEMRTAALIQKVMHGPTVLPAQQTFELATWVCLGHGSGGTNRLTGTR